MMEIAALWSLKYGGRNSLILMHSWKIRFGSA